MQKQEGYCEDVRLGHYILGKTIGKGGFAKVRQARHEVTNVGVAVKIINKLLMKNKNMISKVKREIKILKFISHPNVIKLYEVLDTTNDIFVIMEMAKGGELYQYIQKHNLTEEQVKVFFRQIIEGVESAHLNLVCHRDLKPQNILLDQNKVIKIADFGLSNLMKDGKLLKTSCGSLNYAAPQIIGHRNYEGTALDVWSCGVILYTMLFGALPFDEEIVSLLYKKIEKGEYTVPDFANPLARDLLSRMLQVNPCKRIKVSQIKLHPWLRKYVPIYAQLSFFSNIHKKLQFTLDQQILQRVNKLSLESLRSMKDIQRIGKTIKNRMDDSFVVAYELLKDEKESNNYYSNYLCLQNETSNNNIIFEPKINKLQREQIQQWPQFFFGHSFKKSSKIVIEIILQILQRQKIKYTIKNNQYCILCIYYASQKITRKKEKGWADKIYGYQDEVRFDKHQIKFTIQLYSKPSKNVQVLLDLKLTQGHPLVFLPFSHKLHQLIKQAIDQ